MQGSSRSGRANRCSEGTPILTLVISQAEALGDITKDRRAVGPLIRGALKDREGAVRDSAAKSAW